MIAPALLFSVLLALPILNANAYGAGGFSTLYLRQLSLHDSSLDKRQTFVCDEYIVFPFHIPCILYASVNIRVLAALDTLRAQMT